MALTAAEIAAEDRAPNFRSFCICMIIFSTIAVMLRFWSRSLIQGKMRFWWDDWLALFTWVMSTIDLGLMIWWTTFGLGKHWYTMPFPTLVKGLHGLFIGYFFFYFGVAGAKFSCLLFYSRVFTIRDRTFRLGLWTLGTIVASWVIFCVVSTIFQCTPIHKAWEPLVPGHCLNSYKWWSSSSISNIIIDVLILLWPMPQIWKLQMGRGRVALLFGVFTAGYCVVVISTGKTVTILKDNSELVPDITYNIIPSFFWLAAEAPISIISICLPAIFSLCKRGVTLGPSALFSSKLSYSGGSWSKGQSNDGEKGSEGFARLNKSQVGGKSQFGSREQDIQMTAVETV